VRGNIPIHTIPGNGVTSIKTTFKSGLIITEIMNIKAALYSYMNNPLKILKSQTEILMSDSRIEGPGHSFGDHYVLPIQKPNFIHYMLKQIVMLQTILVLFQVSFGQQDIIPKQYQSIKEVYGDLDKDGIQEKVVVYNMSDKEDEINGIDREVVIFKKDKGNWKIWERSTSAVGNSQDGGMMGDPFEDIEIKNGILLISQSGGSSWKWGHTDKYRYQNNNFELIGYTSNFGKLCEYWVSVDFNVMTGKINVSKEYEKCDEDDESQTVYKKENENFTYKLKNKLTLKNRKKEEVKIITPKYKHELYL